MRKTAIVAMSGEQAQALGHVPHPLVSQRRILWNKVLYFFGLKPSIPQRPEWLQV